MAEFNMPDQNLHDQINVGRDFINNYINQPRPTSISGNNFVHLLPRARDFQDRPELEHLCDWWKDHSGGLCALVGIGGAGKTSLVEHFLRLLPGVLSKTPDLPKDQSLPKPVGLFVFSFYNAPNPETFFAKLWSYLSGKPENMSTHRPSYEETLQLLQKFSSLLLILDGLEKIQDDGSRGNLGHIKDSNLRKFLLQIARGYVPGVNVLVTTRFVLDDLEFDASPNYQSIPIQQIPINACITLLRRRGARGTDSDLKSIAEACGRHALTVDLAGGYIAYFGNGNPHTPLDFPSTAELRKIAGKTRDRQRRYILEQNARFAQIAERYYEALTQSDPVALLLLERVCLFRLGVTLKLLTSIFIGQDKERVSGKLALIDPDQLQEKLDLLSDMHLLEQSSEFYTVHPAVRDGFLGQMDSETIRASHDAARKGLTIGLEARPGTGYPTDPLTIDLLEEIIYHTLEAGFIEEAWLIYWVRTGRYGNLGRKLGFAEQGKRICDGFLDSDGDSKLSDVIETAYLYNNLALYYRDLGQLHTALNFLEKGIEIRKQAGSTAFKALGFRNIANLCTQIGELQMALEYANSAVENGEGTSDKVLGASVLGRVQFLMGKVSEALENFSLLEQESRPIDGAGNIMFYPDLWKADVYRRIGDLATAETIVRDAIEAASASNYRLDVARLNLLFANLIYEGGDLQRSESLIEQEYSWAIAKGSKELLCLAALLRTQIAVSKVIISTQQEDKSFLPELINIAFTYTREGLDIACDHGFGLHYIDLLMLRAQLHLLKSDAKAAQQDCQIALFGQSATTRRRRDSFDHPLDETSPPEDRIILVWGTAVQARLLAATHPAGGYVWGQCRAYQILVESLLLQAAQTLGSDVYDPDSYHKLPSEVQSLIRQAQYNLNRCFALSSRIQDPKLAEIEQILNQINDGVLTYYSL